MNNLVFDAYHWAYFYTHELVGRNPARGHYALLVE